MSSIQSAYQGFAKQNYTMLDNLKLGYGGTKTEMERLLADAEKLTGKKYDLKNLNDVYEAIHVIQTEYNVTGTTAKEAAKTIEGSMNMTKAAWENMLTAIGSGKGVSKATSQLLTSLGTVAKNVAPVALNIVKGLVEGLFKAVPKLVGKLGDFMSKLADMISQGSDGKLGQTAIKLVTSLVKGLIKALPQLAVGAVRLVMALADQLVLAGPRLIAAGLAAIQNFVKGFTNGHPLIATAVQTIGKVIQAALNPVITIINAVIKVWKKLMGQKSKKKFTVDAPFSGAIKSIGDVFKKWKDVLGQKAKKTYSIAKSGFESALDKMRSIWNKWKDILNQKSTKHFSITSSGKVPQGGGGGKRIGLREVPYDGYEAILHKGEAVMTAAEVNKLKKQGDSTTNNGDLTVNVYGTNNMDVNALAAAVERRIINIQKRRTSAWA